MYLLVGVLLTTVFACLECSPIEVPAGLRPAKAIGETEAPPTAKTVVPRSEKPVAPSSARVPPNLSLRSRNVAAVNSNQLVRRGDSGVEEVGSYGV